MVDINILKRKISQIEFSLKRIEKYKNISFNEFSDNQDIIDISLHNLYIILQQIIDIGSHIIADDNLGDIVFMTDIGKILYKEKIISKEISNEIILMIGLRNIIAHEYGNLDLEIVHNVITTKLSVIYKFLDSIIIFSNL